MVVVFLRDAQWGAEQQMANPGLDEGEGGAVRVSGGHHHLEANGGELEKIRPIFFRIFTRASIFEHQNCLIHCDINNVKNNCDVVCATGGALSLMKQL